MVECADYPYLLFSPITEEEMAKPLFEIIEEEINLYPTYIKKVGNLAGKKEQSRKEELDQIIIIKSVLKLFEVMTFC